MGYLCDFICAYEHVFIACGVLIAVTAFASALTALTPSISKVVQGRDEIEDMDIDQLEELQTEAYEFDDNHIKEAQSLSRINHKEVNPYF